MKYLQKTFLLTGGFVQIEKMKEVVKLYLGEPGFLIC